jgi:hypothetical protein
MPDRIKFRRLFNDLPIPTVDFNLANISFTAAMAKRMGSVFAAAPIIQGKRDGSGTGDLVTATRGAQVATSFYTNFDPYQGNINLWITPEWAGNDGIRHVFLQASTNFILEKDASNNLKLTVASGKSMTVDASAWTAGTKYHITAAWDSKNKLDGTNYARLSVNDTHTFGITSTWTPEAPSSTLTVGVLSDGTLSANAILEGFCIFRHVLFDGTYGQNFGNGDEINLIYAAGAGKDPCLVTSSWDVCFCLPTNSTVGALATGAGEAWSHPHSSNLLTDWLMASRNINKQWSMGFNGSTSKIDCGRTNGLDDLHDGEVTAEAWVRTTSTNRLTLFSKGRYGTEGWAVHVTNNKVEAYFQCATSAAASATSANSLPVDGKWHHVSCYFNDAGDRKIYIAVDGVWCTYVSQTAGVGAIISDAAYNLLLGMNNTSYAFVGNMGWTRISNNARYTVGTNFVPAKTPPAADANTLAQWNMAEGTGTTVDNIETTASRDGTITAGTWTPEWYNVGNPLFSYSLAFNGTTTVVNCGKTNGLDDLQDAEFTAEAWIRIPVGTTGARYILLKGSGSVGWFCFWDSGSFVARVMCATSHATLSTTAIMPADGKWHHVAMYFNDAGDRKVYFELDGVWSGTQVAGVGAIVTDAAINLNIGAAGFIGNMGWSRISNNDRLGHGVNFTPAPRALPPAVDANTLAQWNMTEGCGVALDNAETTATRDGVITAGTWVNINAGAMDEDNGGQRIYNWGLSWTAQADGDGIKWTKTGATAGADRVIRCVAHSSNASPINITVYDETNSAVIKDFDFGASSTVNAPGIALFSFELPTNARGAAADCVSYSVIITGTAANQVVYIHQCEMLNNLVDAPSLDAGAAADPFIPYGFTNVDLDAGDTVTETTIIHSTGASLKVDTGAVAAEGLSVPITIAINKFVAFGSWAYAQSDATISMLATKYSKQTALATAFLLSQATGNTWKHSAGIARVVAANSLLYTYGDAILHYLDDLYAIALDDVSLTATPATQANSLESGGIRVDGRDKCIPNPAISLPAASGRVRFKWIPRSAAANWYKFKGSVDPVLLQVDDGTANNRIVLSLSAANTMKLTVTYGGVSVNTTWNATGAIAAGTTYSVIVRYQSGSVFVDIDGVNKITLAAGAFAAALTALYYGSDATPAGAADAVFIAP